MSDDLIKRLRDADEMSAQRTFGSTILSDAADALEAAKRENERLREILREIGGLGVICASDMALVALRDAAALATDQKGGE